MLSEEEFKTRFRKKIMSLVNDWFNEERREKVIDDNYKSYVEQPVFSPEALAGTEFDSWSERGTEIC